MRIVGIDPGLHIGIAVIEEGKLCASITYPASAIDTVLGYVHVCLPDGGHVVVQVPFCGKGLVSIWHRSPVSFARHTYTCGQIVGALQARSFHVIEQPPLRNIGLKRPVKLWCAEWKWPKGKRPPSEHARDAAQIAREALRRLRLEEITSVTR